MGICVGKSTWCLGPYVKFKPKDQQKSPISLKLPCIYCESESPEISRSPVCWQPILRQLQKKKYHVGNKSDLVTRLPFQD